MTLLGNGSPWMWGGFLLFVCLMLALDLGVFHRKAHAVSPREALTWSVVWVALAFAFGGVLHFTMGPTAALEFGAGYLIEKALAVDNLFVFVAIFAAFGVPQASQHRVLFWGVLGALVMRAGFILAGAAILERFHWTLYVFGGFLIVTGLKMFKARTEATQVDESGMLRLLRRWLPVTDGLRGDRFFVIEAGLRKVTPLFVALLLVELADVVFALDSIPAIFAVTRDPFLVFTSNIFAILGLRSMYFLLADLLPRFVHLKAGLAMVLCFVGGKMLLLDVVKVPIGVSLGVVAALLGGSILLSLRATAPVAAPVPPQP